MDVDYNCRCKSVENAKFAINFVFDSFWKYNFIWLKRDNNKKFREVKIIFLQSEWMKRKYFVWFLIFIKRFYCDRDMVNTTFTKYFRAYWTVLLWRKTTTHFWIILYCIIYFAGFFVCLVIAYFLDTTLLLLLLFYSNYGWICGFFHFLHFWNGKNYTQVKWIQK